MQLDKKIITNLNIHKIYNNIMYINFCTEYIFLPEVVSIGHGFSNLSVQEVKVFSLKKEKNLEL